MSTLCVVAVYDTVENKRTNYTRQMLNSLIENNDFSRHRLFISDNGSCDETQAFYEQFKFKFGKFYPEENLTIRKNGRNLGTANAISLGWRTRKEGEFCMKADNDFTIDYPEWIDLIEEAFSREPLLGIIAAKRGDLEEHPLNENPDWKTKLVMLPHKRGEKWIVVEQCHGAFGTCQVYNPKLLDKIGYLVQPKTGYGFDDMLANIRCKLAGFAQAYIPSLVVNYLDVDENPYWEEKRKIAGEGMKEFNQMKEEFMNGTRKIDYEPNWKELES